MLLRSCARRGAAGRRDYALMLLTLRLGLRATEVPTPRLDDINVLSMMNKCCPQAATPAVRDSQDLCV